MLRGKGLKALKALVLKNLWFTSLTPLCLIVGGGVEINFVKQICLEMI